MNTTPLDNFGTSAADFGPAPDIDLERLKKEVDQPIVLQKIGIRTFAGIMEKVVFTATIREIGERFNFQKLLARSDFDTESTHAGNRDITESHWKAIEEFIETDDRPYLGMFVVAMRREEAEIELIQEIDKCAWLAKLTVRANAEHPTLLDAQHRTMGAMKAWATVHNLDEETATAEQLALRDRLASTSVTIEMLFEHERDVLSTIFVHMGSTKPITKDLIAVMDRSQFQNKLGADVTEKSDLFRHRTTYLGVKAGRQLAEKRGRAYEALYSAGNVVDASATIAGVGVRDRSPKQREDLLTKIILERSRTMGRSRDDAMDAIGSEIAALIDYAYERIPGWAELKKGRIDVDDFKDQYVHGTAAGLKVIAIVLAAAKAAGVSPQRAIEVMARVIHWRRDALRDGEGEDGGYAMVHQFFEGTLVKTALDEKTGKWKGGTAGARRDLYQAAADKVLRAIADADPSLKPIMSPGTYAAVGLGTGAGRGRPKKAIA